MREWLSATSATTLIGGGGDESVAAFAVPFWGSGFSRRKRPATFDKRA
jgi:hypothetical protein